LHNDPVPEEAPLASGLLEAVKKYQQENAAQEWKAPGAERLPKTDWAQEKLLANKVMQERATGSRVPTDHWAGFGFSRSMPAAVIRQRLLEESRQKQNKLKDLVEEDEDKIGPWRLEPNNIINEPHRKALNATSYFDFAPSNNGINFSDGDDVVTLLTKLELSKYVDIFREQEIDMKTFLTMTDEDLKDVGVNAFGPRKKMLRTISELNESKKHFA
jgi:protein bicaudal C